MDKATPFVSLLDQRIQQLEEALDAPSPNETELLGDLHGLSNRLAGERLQLAVIGQFKRGKSSLLNALIGEEVLPSGILPVTALATSLEPGEPCVIVGFKDGRSECFQTGNAEEMRGALRMFVSETGNPDNRKGVRDVHVRLPSPLLDAGVVLIDTPGVGSTFEHNTKAAEAALPDADVALFVLSPDPPITQVEVDYLKEARGHAARMILVLNKCDLLTAGEREETVAFVRETIRATSGMEAAEIACVSARAALEASRDDDPAALEDSGIPELRARLMRFAKEEKGDALRDAVEKKTARLIANLALENEVALRALEMPIEELARCADELQRAMGGIDLERQRARDLLAGDKLRLVQRVREQVGRVGERVREKVLSELDRRAPQSRDADELAQRLLEEMVGAFAGEFPTLQGHVASDLRSTLEQHIQTAQRIASEIRAAASGVLGIDLALEETRIDADLDLKPAWYDRRIEFLTPLPPGAFDAFLPRKGRMKRAVRRARRDLEAALVRNVEKLRWSLQQAAEESVRSFQASLDRHLDTLKGSTADAVSLALQRRQNESAERSAQIAARERVRGLLAGISARSGARR